MRFGVNDLSDVVDYTEVPYLQEILNYLPIDPVDEEDVSNYIQNITKETHTIESKTENKNLPGN